MEQKNIFISMNVNHKLTNFWKRDILNSNDTNVSLSKCYNSLFSKDSDVCISFYCSLNLSLFNSGLIYTGLLLTLIAETKDFNILQKIDNMYTYLYNFIIAALILYSLLWINVDSFFCNYFLFLGNIPMTIISVFCLISYIKRDKPPPEDDPILPPSENDPNHITVDHSIKTQKN